MDKRDNTRSLAWSRHSRSDLLHPVVHLRYRLPDYKISLSAKPLQAVIMIAPCPCLAQFDRSQRRFAICRDCEVFFLPPCQSFQCTPAASHNLIVLRKYMLQKEATRSFRSVIVCTLVADLRRSCSRMRGCEGRGRTSTRLALVLLSTRSHLLSGSTFDGTRVLGETTRGKRQLREGVSAPRCGREADYSAQRVGSNIPRSGRAYNWHEHTQWQSCRRSLS